MHEPKTTKMPKWVETILYVVVVSVALGLTALFLVGCWAVGQAAINVMNP